MKVRVVKTFAGQWNGELKRWRQGDIIDLPPGVDWLKAGLVEPVRSVSVETADMEAPEEAVMVKKKKGAKKGV